MGPLASRRRPAAGPPQFLRDRGVVLTRLWVPYSWIPLFTQQQPKVPYVQPTPQLDLADGDGAITGAYGTEKVRWSDLAPFGGQFSVPVGCNGGMGSKG
jgi:hypothetical protein